MGLIKSALDDSTKDAIIGTGELAAGAGAGIGGTKLLQRTVKDPKFRENITGRRWLMHGTSPEAAKSIREHGLKRTTAKNAINTNVIGDDATREAAYNKVYLTEDPKCAKLYAGQGKAGGVRKVNQMAWEGKLDQAGWERLQDRAVKEGGIVHVDMPVYKYERVKNPETELYRRQWGEQVKRGWMTPEEMQKKTNEEGFKMLENAYVSPHDVEAKYIKGKNYKGVGLRDLYEYARARPQTFGRTAGKLALGGGGLLGAGYLGYKGLKNLYGAATNDSE